MEATRKARFMYLPRYACVCVLVCVYACVCVCAYVCECACSCMHYTVQTHLVFTK